ncbi:hypothetical protein JZ751_015736 [Albula glossodonta]|uniref:Uncharacterized protein n=1 Tax=Albula glossodonta TaxID=121402 RepID=A0A8T2MY91_9TELE|nr:hypothetical protein JZ751_015736 [Albula glossodonta]
MGNSDSKMNFRKAVIQLTTKTQPVEATDDVFWDQFWADSATSVQDVFALVPAAEIRAVREESPSNLATLCYKAVERLVQAADSGCPSEKERQVALNCVRLLTRVLPYIFEDPDWRGFFWSTVPGAGYAKGDESDEDGARALAESLLLAIADLLFCPDFTVPSNKSSSSDTAEHIQSIDSCEYIWGAGVGFAQAPPLNYIHDLNRTELLKLLLTCFSEAMYLPPSSDPSSHNPWVSFFCSADNRHALPLFTSLLNVVCAYDPVGYGFPYNHLLFSDYREQLVQHAVQILIVSLEHEGGATAPGHSPDPSDSPTALDEQEDLCFILKGLARLLSNPLTQTYLPNSTKKIQFHQELLVLFWKLCDFNKKFLFFVLKSSDVLDILVPILYYLNDARADQSRLGQVHIGVFILLLLSGERNFGIITNGHQRLQPLFDCLLTIIVNVSPYLKSLSMVAANKLLHLLEAFSSHWFLFSASQNHHLVFFLLEVFNNIIQYQFDGNCKLVYALIRKRVAFHQLANLPTDSASLQRALQRKKRSPGGIDKLTEKSQVSEDGTMVSVQQSDPPPGHSAGTSDTESNLGRDTEDLFCTEMGQKQLTSTSSTTPWTPTPEWVLSWKAKLPLQTIMRLLQVLVPQVEKICIDKGLTDESEILRFLQHGTLVGLLPVPHPILIRKYQANAGTAMWFRTYMWGVVYLRNVDPPIWYDTDVRLFDIQRCLWPSPCLPPESAGAASSCPSRGSAPGMRVVSFLSFPCCVQRQERDSVLNGVEDSVGVAWAGVGVTEAVETIDDKDILQHELQQAEE